MSRPKSKPSELDERIARCEAEDSVVRLLDGDRELAAIQAVKLYELTAGLWEMEQNAMLHRDDPREVYPITTEDDCWRGFAVARCSQDPRWHTCSTWSLLAVLASLPPDAAALTADSIARWAYHRSGLK